MPKTEPLFHDRVEVVVSEIELSHRRVLLAAVCKALRPAFSEPIVAEIEDSQRWTLPQHRCKALHPAVPDLIQSEIDLIQFWTLSNRTRNRLHPITSDITTLELKVSERAAMPQDVCKGNCSRTPERTLGESEHLQGRSPGQHTCNRRSRRKKIVVQV